jgi:hypothetical protein
MQGHLGDANRVHDPHMLERPGVPIIVRMRSARYDESIWCARGFELFEYQIRSADFLRGRRVVDLDVGDITELRLLGRDGDQAATSKTHPPLIFHRWR